MDKLAYYFQIHGIVECLLDGLGIGILEQHSRRVLEIQKGILERTAVTVVFCVWLHI